jgi:dUTP pyrophosphatase
MLNGKEAAENGWITNYDPKKAVQQHGIDLRLTRVERLEKNSYNIGAVFCTHTAPGSWEEVTLKTYAEAAGKVWLLDPGYYQVLFAEGMNVPADKMCLCIQRSGLARCGAQLHSSVYDAGYKTDRIGTFMVVHHDIIIEYNARVCQALFFEAHEVDNLYSGQWSGGWENKR